LQNEGVTPVATTAEDYQFWRARFGATSGSGSANAVQGPAGEAVPEPAALVFVLASAMVVLSRRTERLIAR
jgi:hypothetical protein